MGRRETQFFKSGQWFWKLENGNWKMDTPARSLACCPPSGFDSPFSNFHFPVSRMVMHVSTNVKFDSRLFRSCR
jgi:hypothetical protein